MDTATTTPTQLYESDLNAWCEQQAALLRARAQLGANDGLDYENLAEEIDTLGRSQRNALRSHMVVLLLHLLKWRYQPAQRSRSWENSIANARAEIAYALDDSPSLRPFLGETVERAFPIAVRNAETETGLERRTLPPSCPFTVEQIIDSGFLPDGIDGGGQS